ncbi:chitooligosaccharidolytic beta-N-acetylglucosaminidase-like [Microplitis mediator]|uniref:chitooligosaccharidolytic beta-N-acetylglucosaminidase-like n=1 Tax=Microplitis mediator TaxID=375433 RepID=UPI0025530520|nr:chitooligosaccharidolytic beta-N-acetylglucosaminidase-like [Microplitis mediator]
MRKVNAFRSYLRAFKPNMTRLVRRRKMQIIVYDLQNTNDMSLTLETKEGYELKISTQGYSVDVELRADNYFGIRNGLETLEQLITFNEISNEVQIVKHAWFVDSPAYPYRGILVDTSRNYITKSAIMKTIEAMGMSKLNTLHWHITDQQSFPYVSRTWPNMTRYGAYSPSKVYTAADIKEIKEFGIYHGVRVVPELDAPAHVGEGWQWIGDDALLCYRAEPWMFSCSVPPCGQLNPISNRVFEILEGLYKDLLEDFEPDVFHMGGDQVNRNCWQSSEVIKRWVNTTDSKLSDADFIHLWASFQKRAYEKLKLANGGKDIQAILWSSDLTKKQNLYQLDNRKYIIQNWMGQDDHQTIKDLFENDFRVIFSQYDVHYLDCGFGSHVGSGNNWCSPYNDWRKIYEYSPSRVINKLKLQSKRHLIFGGEVVLWSESVDSSSLDARLWPRAAALAGRLWSEKENRWMDVESRVYRHRERLVDRGIFAGHLAPEWCLQNQEICRWPHYVTLLDDAIYYLNDSK